jgi:glycerate 2-kinase
MHVLIAPNAFKHSLTATEAAQAIQRGFETCANPSSAHPLPRVSDHPDPTRTPGHPPFTTECFPVGDGGDGTGDLLIERLGGRRIAAQARNPFGKPISTYWGLAGDSRTAIIEMANASGLRLLDSNELDPLKASSIGAGDLILAALDKNVRRIILGMGGSATVDGAAGILQALGVRFLNADGQPLINLPGSLTDLAVIDMEGLDPRLEKVELMVLCDVDNPLTGPQGAAAVFGPQKGASEQDVRQLDACLEQFARVIHTQTGRVLSNLPRAGTAGGAAGGLYGVLGARLVSGIDYFLETTGFEAALDRCDCVITGEGSIDEQTLQGKAPHGIAIRAKKKGRPVIVLAGKVPLHEIPELKEYFDVLLPISHAPVDLPTALRNTASDLQRTAAQLGNLLAGVTPRK